MEIYIRYSQSNRPLRLKSASPTKVPFPSRANKNLRKTLISNNYVEIGKLEA